jgi:hypothetical protein
MEYKTAKFRWPLGKGRRAVSAQDVEHTVSQFAKGLKSRFQDQLARDPAGFKKQVVRLIRQALPPKRGRPNNPRLDAAVQMVEQGKTVKDVLRLQIPGYDNLDTYGRYLAEKGLRAAITRRRRSTASRDLQRNSGQFSSRGNPTKLKG